jgi:hypothetical protein
MAAFNTKHRPPTTHRSHAPFVTFLTGWSSPTPCDRTLLGTLTHQRRQVHTLVRFEDRRLHPSFSLFLMLKGWSKSRDIYLPPRFFLFKSDALSFLPLPPTLGLLLV